MSSPEQEKRFEVGDQVYIIDTNALASLQSEPHWRTVKDITWLHSGVVVEFKRSTVGWLAIVYDRTIRQAAQVFEKRLCKTRREAYQMLRSVANERARILERAAEEFQRLADTQEERE